MIKRFVTSMIMAVALVVAAAPAVHAQEAAKPVASAALKVAVVDVRKILQEAKAAKNVDEQLQALYETYRKEVEKQENDLRAAQKKLEEDQPNLTQEQFLTRRKEFETKVAEAQKTVQTKKQALDKALGESRNTLQRTIVQATEDIAKQQGYQLVIQAAMVLTRVGNIDITNTVLAEVDKRLPSLKVELK